MKPAAKMKLAYVRLDILPQTRHAKWVIKFKVLGKVRRSVLEESLCIWAMSLQSLAGCGRYNLPTTIVGRLGHLDRSEVAGNLVAKTKAHRHESALQSQFMLAHYFEAAPHCRLWRPCSQYFPQSPWRDPI